MPGIEFTKIILPIGISYTTFRLIHYLVETYKGNIPENTFTDFALYILFFPTFLAGPIERFPQFHSQTINAKKINADEVSYGLFRIATGIIKKILVVYYLNNLISPILYTPELYSWGIVLIAVYGSAILIYADFSGYSDIAIGSARLFGYKIMENFNYPFFKKNIALFWKNWHISLYTWIRDYFFLPLFGWRASTFKLYCGIFTTIMVLHLWHEVSSRFLIMGCYFGIGLIIWQVFQEIKKICRWPVIFNDKPGISLFSTFLTFNFVSLGMVFFRFNTDQAFKILKWIFGGV